MPFVVVPIIINNSVKYLLSINNRRSIFSHEKLNKLANNTINDLNYLYESEDGKTIQTNSLDAIMDELKSFKLLTNELKEGMSNICQDIEEMLRKKQTGFWGMYFRFYDALNRVYPYTQLLNDGISLLNIASGGKYLDAGCGTGNSSVEMIKRGGDVVGIDYAKAGLDIARKKIRFGDLNKPLPYDDNAFSGIFCNNVIYSLEQPQKTIDQFYRILKQNGKLVVATPLAGSSIFAIFIEHYKKKGAINTLSLLPHFIILGLFTIIIKIKRDKGIYHHFTRESLISIFREAGFREIHSKISYAGHDIIVVGQK